MGGKYTINIYHSKRSQRFFGLLVKVYPIEAQHKGLIQIKAIALRVIP
jgi:hypothetical protein